MTSGQTGNATEGDAADQPDQCKRNVEITFHKKSDRIVLKQFNPSDFMFDPTLHVLKLDLTR